jgi:REP element-mobilizing transposase RayT
MPRGPRVDFPGAVQHVYARGIEKRKIFFDDQDLRKFLDGVGDNLPRWGVHCFAWALMPNHFHLLIRSDNGQLPSFMRCLLTGYAKYFNTRHERVGHLFQNRYKSRLVGTESHFREVTRYIHLNPLRGGIVSSLDVLDHYPWAGHGRVMGSPGPDWHEIDVFRSLFSFGPGDDRWRDHYRSYLGVFSIGLTGTEKTDAEVDTFARAGIPAMSHSGESAEEPPDGFFVILDRISYSTGIPRDRIAGGRKYAEVQARRRVLVDCVSGMEVPVARICRWLGIKAGAGEYLVRTAERDRRSFEERPGS